LEENKKKRGYGLQLIKQDLWGKYARKRSNNYVTSKHEWLLKYHDDLLYRTQGSPIVWFYYQLKNRREGFPYKLTEDIKERTFRTRKLLQIYYENLKFHNIKIHMKKAKKKWIRFYC